jgi:hypothetical protein
MSTQVSPRIVADASTEAGYYLRELRQHQPLEVIRVEYVREGYALHFSDGTVEIVLGDPQQLTASDLWHAGCDD